MADEGKGPEKEEVGAAHSDNGGILAISAVHSDGAVYEGVGDDGAAVEESDLDVVVTVTPPEGDTRCPVDMICVVDTSYSMSSEASMKTDGGVEERHGLSLLDVVKHAVKTIAKTLGSNDRLAIVKFSDEAQVVCNLTAMTEKGQKQLIGQVETLKPELRTNIWDGLKVALETIRHRSEKAKRKPVIALLTDGRPNISPPRGEVEMLKRYRDQHNLECTISTFGFGYDLDSELLNELAIEGDGTYAFIPDASFVGTVFIHATANFLTTWANSAVLKLEPDNGAKIVEVVGAPPMDTASWGCQIRLGSLHFGQARSLLVRVALPEGAEPQPKQTYCSALLTYKTSGGDAEGDAGGQSHSVNVDLVASAVEDDDDVKTSLARNRSLLVTILAAAVESYSSDVSQDGLRKSTARVANLIEKVKASAAMKAPENKLTADLLKDLEGQVTEALSKTEFMRKWGRHYLPSLRRAHQLQQCNNFKDPGVQHYGGKLFKEVRDIADDVFCSLPPPKPSVKRPAVSSYSTSRGSSSRGSSSSSKSKSKPSFTSMSAYHYSGNPCFASGRVHMADGSFKDVARIKRGDLVLTGEGDRNPAVATARVECVVKSLTESGRQLVVKLGDLVVTPWHPIQHNEKWSFPADIQTPQEVACDAVYSVVLEEQGTATKAAHSMMIENYPCVTFGHGIEGDEVASHPYFGSRRGIVDDLRKRDGWQTGCVVLPYGCLVRDCDSGMVIGLRT